MRNEGYTLRLDADQLRREADAACLKVVLLFLRLMLLLLSMMMMVMVIMMMMMLLVFFVTILILIIGGCSETDSRHRSGFAGEGEHDGAAQNDQDGDDGDKDGDDKIY